MGENLELRPRSASGSPQVNPAFLGLSGEFIPGGLMPKRKEFDFSAVGE